MAALTSKASVRFQKMEVLHKAPKKIVKWLNYYTLSYYHIVMRYRITVTCFLYVVSYSHDIPERKFLYSFHNGSTIQRRSVRCPFL